jgi:hypothetical protein
MCMSAPVVHRHQQAPHTCRHQAPLASLMCLMLHFDPREDFHPQSSWTRVECMMCTYDICALVCEVLPGKLAGKCWLFAREARWACAV